MWVIVFGMIVYEFIEIYVFWMIWFGFWLVVIVLFVGILFGFYVGLNLNMFFDYVVFFGGIVWCVMLNFWLVIMFVMVFL